jgi:hypothetical protein
MERIKGNYFLLLKLDRGDCVEKQKRRNNGKEILKDHRTYSFSVKLSLIYNMGLISEILFISYL